MNAPGNEMENHDLRTRVVSLEHSDTQNRQRLSDLEKWQRQNEIAEARTDVQFKEMDKKLNKIESTLSRIMWLIIAGLIAGFVSFVLKGGLTIP